MSDRRGLTIARVARVLRRARAARKLREKRAERRGTAQALGTMVRRFPDYGIAGVDD